LKIVGENKYIERVCPNCKEKNIPLYLRTEELDEKQLKFTTAGVGPDPYVYIYGCPKCKALFFDYRM